MGVVGRALASLVEIGFGILLFVAIVLITRWVAEDGDLLIFLLMITITVAWMIVSFKLHDFGREHRLRRAARILAHLALLSIFGALWYGVAWVTKSRAVVSGSFVGLLVWSLGMRLLPIREMIRRRAEKQVH